jgi:predicted transcriptional regulator
MTRARNVTPRHTKERLDRLRRLVMTLQDHQLMRDEIGELLEVSPSGVRKYLADLADKIAIVRYVDSTPRHIGHPVYRLTMSAEEVQAYLADLASKEPARPNQRHAPAAPQLDQARHIHIMKDDGDFRPRRLRGIPSHTALMVHFFGMAGIEARA